MSDANELSAFAKDDPFLAIAMLAFGEGGDEPETAFKEFLSERSNDWIVCLSRLIENSSWEGNVSQNDAVAIHGATEIIRSLANMSGYLRERV